MDKTTIEKDLIPIEEMFKNLSDEKKAKASNFIEGFIAGIELLSNKEKEKQKVKTG